MYVTGHHILHFSLIVFLRVKLFYCAGIQLHPLVHYDSNVLQVIEVSCGQLKLAESFKRDCPGRWLIILGDVCIVVVQPALQFLTLALPVPVSSSSVTWCVRVRACVHACICRHLCVCGLYGKTEFTLYTIDHNWCHQPNHPFSECSSYSLCPPSCFPGSTFLSILSTWVNKRCIPSCQCLCLPTSAL